MGKSFVDATKPAFAAKSDVFLSFIFLQGNKQNWNLTAEEYEDFLHLAISTAIKDCKLRVSIGIFNLSLAILAPFDLRNENKMIVGVRLCYNRPSSFD